MRPEMTRRQSARRPESGPVKRGFLRPGALCSLAAAAVLAFAGAGTAVAQPSGGPGAPAARATTASSGSAGSSNSTARLSDGTVVDSAAAASKVQDYWTPERMKNAIPLDAPDPGTPPSGSAGPVAAPTGEPGSTEPVAPTVPGRAGLREPLIDESAAVGKVFFTDPSDGKDHVCSGSALNSPSRQLVITAGSCVHGGQGKTWMTNWIYAPRYRSGSYPFGTYAAKQFRAFDAWMSSSAPSRNVGLVTTWPQNGTRLVDATGGRASPGTTRRTWTSRPSPTRSTAATARSSSGAPAPPRGATSAGPSGSTAASAPGHPAAPGCASSTTPPASATSTA